MLTKQDWRLLNNTSALATQVFNKNYYERGTFTEAKLRASPSLIWRSIWRPKNLLIEGLRWRVCNEKSINIWNNRWLPTSCYFIR